MTETALNIAAVAKSFGGQQVLRGVDLTIRPGEFFTLLGPSGCGKTTLLRILAGFLRPDEGQVTLGTERLDTKPAHQRDIGMVFQDYAVFPHLTVADNIAFGLKTRGLPAAEIASRVEEGLRMVRLEGFGGRYPAEMSGGQQQRVGIARAMVIRPKLLLMDEPLSNLDAKLRVEMREDIRALQKQLGVTAIYVTHDQEEALAISDRICVMNGGIAEQVGTPAEIYRHPRRRFPAAFVGTMNFLRLAIAGDTLTLGSLPLKLAAPAQGTVEIAIRPEYVEIAGAGLAPRSDAALLAGSVVRTTYLGTHAICAVATGHGEVLVQIKDPGDDVASEGDPVTLVLPRARLAVFSNTGDRLDLGS